MSSYSWLGGIPFDNGFSACNCYVTRYTERMQTQSRQLGFLSVGEAAAAIGITTGYVRQLLIKGELKGQKLGIRTWAIPISEVERFQEQPLPKTGRPRSQ